MGADIYLKSTNGYFRDSYNNSSLFAAIGKSWWGMCGKDDGIDDNGFMSVSSMQKLREELQGIEITSDSIAKNWGDDTFGETPDNELADYMIDKRKDLLLLLDKAIELNEPLFCSV